MGDDVLHVIDRGARWLDEQAARMRLVHDVGAEQQDEHPSATEILRGWLDAGELLARPTQSIDWLVDGILPAGTAGDVFGPPDSGKSTLILHLAAHIAAGRPNWMGLRIAGGPVLFVGGEKSSADVWIRDLHRTAGASGIKPEELRGRMIIAPAAEGPLWRWEGHTWLPQAALTRLLGVARAIRPVLVVMDTVGRAAAGQSPIEIAQQQLLAEQIEWLQRQTGGAVLTISHTNQESRRGELIDRLAWESRAGSSGLPGHFLWLLGVAGLTADEQEKLGLRPGKYLAVGVTKNNEMPQAVWNRYEPAILQLQMDGSILLVRDGRETRARGGIAEALKTKAAGVVEWSHKNNGKGKGREPAAY